MRTIILAMSIFLSVISCNTQKKAGTQKDYAIFTLRKTNCRGKCPVYLLEIYKSGQMKLKGSKNIDKIGEYKNTISKDELNTLIKEFEQADFFSFKDEYVAKITDLPTTYISYSTGKKTKKIRDYHGSPEVLKNLEKKLEQFVSWTGWRKVE